jgi:Zn-dependent protease
LNTSSIRLGVLLGIPIFVHTTTLWFLLGIALLVSGEMAIATAIVLSIVLLHELGHSVAARRYGIDVLKISIYPFGGMAHMAMIPERPKEELIVALAGPLTNFALAIPGVVVLALTGFGRTHLSEAPLVALAWYWTWINIVLGGFNLLPAFPMDGGRVLRALLVPKLGYLGATEVAVRVGRWIAGGMALWAIVGPGFGVGLFFVAVFVWLMGTRELFAVRMRNAMPFGMGGAPGAGNPFGPSANMNDVFARMFSMGNMPGGPARPTEPEPPRPPGEVEIVVEPKADQAGFSESEIRRLEASHGRLPRRPRSE